MQIPDSDGESSSLLVCHHTIQVLFNCMPDWHMPLLTYAQVFVVTAPTYYHMLCNCTPHRHMSLLAYA